MENILTLLSNQSNWPWPVALAVLVFSIGYFCAQLAKLIEAWRKRYD